VEQGKRYESLAKDIGMLKKTGLLVSALACVSTSGCKSPSTVDEVFFADRVFRDCVTSVYSVDTPVSEVVELNCQFSPISSLMGAQWFSQLKIMRLEGPNTITDLKPVAKLPQFSILSLYGLSQDLVDVSPLLGAPAFSELYVENGPKLDCQGVKSLREKLGANYVIVANGVCQGG
jgi:hypothetical protein